MKNERRGRRGKEGRGREVRVTGINMRNRIKMKECEEEYYKTKKREKKIQAVGNGKERKGRCTERS